MQIMGKYGKEDIALLYIAKINDNLVEFVESVQPLLPREKKWVLIVSSVVVGVLGVAAISVVLVRINSERKVK